MGKTIATVVTIAIPAMEILMALCVTIAIIVILVNIVTTTNQESILWNTISRKYKSLNLAT